ncbi:MAG: single-stranded-DNA-specific exonuclease RecJ [Ruminococcaceae bacterium]|nr:single-stranded-DNA-specific exonuclease RecJ [Oscillospiraceae bacterium]
MRRKKWVVTKGNKDLAAQIAQELSVDPFAALLATSRGFDNIDEIGDFFDPDAPLQLSPLSIADMGKAAERINRAIDEFEFICVFGDYDADGVTATALLYSYLETRGANVIRYIPDRLTEGYGLNISAVEKLADMGVKLIITVDNGVSAIDEAIRAKELGIDLVVTDHHKVGEVLPDAVAVVDPHRSDCPSSFKEMSGVGVAFKLVCALEGDDGDILIEEYGDLVALGTIGDVVTLTGENRVMVRRGLRLINENPRPGINALMEIAGVSEKFFSASTAAFTVCPRINAAGRMGSAHKALDLLLCEDEELAEQLAEEINQMNIQRQQTETSIFAQVQSMLSAGSDMLNDRIIVVDGEGWHQGVIGIVAARITERYGRPCVVISRDGETARGSCRSIEGFSIYDAIEAVSDCVDHFGGHTLAAGLGLDSSRIEEFRRRINEYAADKEMPFALQKVDCRLLPSSISLNILSAIGMLEPFGSGNPQPCFGLFGVRIDEIAGVSDGKHIRMVISKNGARTGVVYFGMAERRFPYEKGDVVDLAVNLDRNVYNGETRVSVIVRGIRPSLTEEEKVLSAISLYEKFSRHEKLTADEATCILPDRQLQVDVFKSIKAKPLRDRCYESLCIRLGDNGSSLAKINVIVDIMLEMGILEADIEDVIRVPDNPPKVNLEDSEIMKRIRSFL